MFAFPAHRGPLTLGCVSMPDRKANEGLLALSQEETMPISIRQLAYGTVPKLCTVCFCVCVAYKLADRSVDFHSRLTQGLLMSIC